jgi:NADH dehydrogenase/NADH:ubiquinone oxidoreductase subunit G
MFINNKPISVPDQTTVLQAVELSGLEIPKFCFDERLAIAGNCRICLVELLNSPKPVVACATPVMNGMSVFTNSPLVLKARENVLEFLLLNHPLDCPICDQGGDCDLQDLTFLIGSDKSRFFYKKTSVEDHFYGVLIKTVMTRCIYCTRCIRFLDQVGGLPVLGSLNRGQSTDIGTFVEKSIDCELSANVIDICPVGALTAKPYAFKKRTWELKSTQAFDFSDSLHSPLNIYHTGSSVSKVVPVFDSSVNDGWISDKARFCYDGLKQQRVHACGEWYSTIQSEEVWLEYSWKEALTELDTRW